MADQTEDQRLHMDLLAWKPNDQWHAYTKLEDSPKIATGIYEFDFMTSIGTELKVKMAKQAPVVVFYELNGKVMLPMTTAARADENTVIYHLVFPRYRHQHIGLLHGCRPRTAGEDSEYR